MEIYFLSPSLNAAINYKMGNYHLDNREIMGGLAENLVASTFFKWKETNNIPLNINYLPGKGEADFLLSWNIENIVPVEVGLNKKQTGQLKKSMRKYDSNYGVLISNGFNKIDMNNDIITIPLVTFSFM
jgi:predicted AAA+ superfamily ATPase